MGNPALGIRGEQLAAEHLIGLGWQILQRNWRCTEGEVDLVARDDQQVVLVEVKCRAGTGFGDPLEAITAAKRARLARLAGRWVALHPGVGRVRVDAVGVLLRRGYQPRITHLRGV